MDNMSSTNYADASSATQDPANALLRAQRIWLAGLYDVSKTAADMVQAHQSRSMSNWAALSAAKSLPEALEVQKLHTITSVQEFVACTGKLTGASMTLCQQAMAPITEKVTSIVEKFHPPTA